jgi:hypothetical protein
MNDKAMNISFLRGHVAPLIQSFRPLSLKPGEEEIKKKRLVVVLAVNR